ncbi:hypothetical protein F6X40_09270 [Paraburkholderia sp. UCT31]|nr:hypothetical protein [Paraburkholderia sp. UCT31]
MEVYLVGGAVRDMLMGCEPKDRDYVVIGSSAEQMRALGYAQVGADFPVFLHPQSHDEYALARTERKNGHGYGGFAVSTEAVTLEEDLSRRDITINSMAMRADGTLVDPYGGAADLKAKVIRHTTLAFREDPLRLLRVARFLARFGPDWTIARETQAMLREMVVSGETDHLTPERVWKEVEKGLMEPHPWLMTQALLALGFASRPPFAEYLATEKTYPEAVSRATGDGQPVEVRFALMFSRRWTVDEAKASRIPSSVREVASVTHRLLTWASGHSAQAAPAEDVLELLLTSDAPRQKARFGLVLAALGYVAPDWALALSQGLARVSRVNSRDVIQPGLNGPEIQERMKAARLLALAA